jgi:hypothetical protein
MMMRILGPALAVGWVVMLMMVTFVPLTLYLLARWRDGKQPTADPQLGLKIALGFFSFIGLQTLLGGTTVLFSTMISEGSSDGRSSIYRAAFGLIVPGGIIYGLHAWLLQRTNQAFFTGVKRLMLGFNFIIIGMAGFMALVLSFEALFAKGSTGGMGRTAGTMLVVYGTAWVALGIQLGRMILGDGTPMQPPMYPPPPHQAVPPPPAAPSSPAGLPPLGGGAFPPIEPR